MAFTASFALVSASGAAWKFYHHSIPATEAATMVVAPDPVKASPLEKQEPRREPVPADKEPLSRPAAPAKAARVRETAPHVKTLRAFVPPADQTSTPAQPSSTARAAAPDVSIPPEKVAGLPAGVNWSITVPAPRSPASPAPAPAQPAAQTAAAPPQQQAGGNFHEAQLISHPDPEFPALARQYQLFGAVRLEAAVDEHGAVSAVKILNGVPVLAAAARNAVMKWKYKPATLNGHPIAVKQTITVSFGPPK
jgi:periplasmic protein TonB